jgi:glycosyltransferase involved in cell wall biosynthesis
VTGNSHYRTAIAPVSGGERPLWSVMIPAHDCASYLRETLASVLAQDPGPEHMQIEVVDDASSDEPEAVVAELGGGRVGFFRQPRNVGHVANFNTCLERSRGRLVHLLHGDDCVREGFYAAMSRLLEAEGSAGAAFCRYIAIDEQGNWSSIAALEQRSAGLIEGWLERIATGQRLQTPCMVVRREAYERLGGFDSRGGFAEDWEMWVRIAASYPVAYEPRPLALYRVHSLSRTGRMLRTGENVRDLRRVIDINREHLPPDQADEITRRALRETATTCLRRARRMLGAGDTEAMWAQVREAVRSDASPRVLGEAAAVVAARLVLSGRRRRAA